MTRDRAEKVIGHSGGSRETRKSRESEEWREGTVRREVEIEVDSVVVVEEEIAESVGPLNGMRVRIVGGEEGGIAC